MNITVTENMTLDVTASDERYVIDQVWFFIQKIGGTILTVIGIPGNILAAIVLLQPAMRNSTSIILAVMAVYDFLVLTLYGLVIVLSLVFCHSNLYYNCIVIHDVFNKYLFGVLHIALTGTIYTIVLVTLERATVVLFPLHAKHMCTTTRACIACLVILVCSVIYSIPRFMYYVPETEDDKKRTEYSVTESNFGKSYFNNVVYLVYLNSVFHFIIPIGIIVILNALIIQRIYRREGRNIRVVSSREVSETRLTIMIIIETIIFCVCQLLAVLQLILYPLEMFNEIGVEQFSYSCSLTCHVVWAVAETSVILNSAINFIVYIIVGKKFRQCLKNLCCSH